MKTLKILVWFFLGALTAQAQLAVTVFPPKITGQKAIVQLTMTNNLAEKVVGQSTKWVIGGTKDRPALEPKNETTFNFVITSSQPFTTTNLTANVSFSRVVLENGKLADVGKTVNVTTAVK